MECGSVASALGLLMFLCCHLMCRLGSSSVVIDENMTPVALGLGQELNSELGAIKQITPGAS